MRFSGHTTLQCECSSYRRYNGCALSEPAAICMAWTITDTARKLYNNTYQQCRMRFSSHTTLQCECSSYRRYNGCALSEPAAICMAWTITDTARKLYNNTYQQRRMRFSSHTTLQCECSSYRRYNGCALSEPAAICMAWTITDTARKLYNNTYQQRRMRFSSHTTFQCECSSYRRYNGCALSEPAAICMARTITDTAWKLYNNSYQQRRMRFSSHTTLQCECSSYRRYNSCALSEPAAICMAWTITDAARRLYNNTYQQCRMRFSSHTTLQCECSSYRRYNSCALSEPAAICMAWTITDAAR